MGSSSPTDSEKARPSAPRSSSIARDGGTKYVMDAPVFVPQNPSFRQMSTAKQHSYQSGQQTSGSSQKETSSSSNALSQSGYGPNTSILIRRLPLTTTTDSLRSMVVWSKELVEAEVLSSEQSEDAGFRCAVLRFKTPAAAQEAQLMLDGKPNIANDAEMVVELIPGSLLLDRRLAAEGSRSSSMSNSAQGGSGSHASVSMTVARHASRFNGTFQSMDRISPTANLSTYTGNELPDPESSAHYQSLFSPQSPIGNHLDERTRISGKSLINDDSLDDDETRELLKDPVGYAENGPSSLPLRRGTAPQLQISRMTNLSLNTAPNGVSSVSVYPAQPGISATHVSQIGPMSPSVTSPGKPLLRYPLNTQQYQRSNFPPVNPADQNPPCNTLYVGNLPIDTSEDELKAMFSKQRGYKRLCFRTKQNGPMCFVEFEDISFATKALHELYGHPLHNSVKGGIRLSFSKNPLGVRSGQTPGASVHVAAPNGSSSMAALLNGKSGSAYVSVNGPPPGLALPRGLGSTRPQLGALIGPTAYPTPTPHYGFNAYPRHALWGGDGYGIPHGLPTGEQTPGTASVYGSTYMMGR